MRPLHLFSELAEFSTRATPKARAKATASGTGAVSEGLATFGELHGEASARLTPSSLTISNLILTTSNKGDCWNEPNKRIHSKINEFTAKSKSISGLNDNLCRWRLLEMEKKKRLQEKWRPAISLEEWLLARTDRALRILQKNRIFFLIYGDRRRLKEMKSISQMPIKAAGGGSMGNTYPVVINNPVHNLNPHGAHFLLVQRVGRRETHKCLCSGDCKLTWSVVFIVSDQDTCFTSLSRKKSQEELRAQLCFSSNYHPRTDGRSERTIQIIRDMFHICVIDFRNLGRHPPQPAPPLPETELPSVAAFYRPKPPPGLSPMVVVSVFEVRQKVHQREGERDGSIVKEGRGAKS
ncbi:hypothetical protein LXL04_036077 [Taraxacum kok-saghyz]